MINFRPGSQVHRLVTLLSVVGEFPVYSLHLLGSSQVYKRLVRKVIHEQEFRNSQTGTVVTCRLLSVSGHGKSKTIRLHRTALPILEWISFESYECYMHISLNHHFSGGTNQIERNHRIAEAVAMFMRLGYEFRPYKLPDLGGIYPESVRLTRYSFYNSKLLKTAVHSEANKTTFTRMIGALITDERCFVVYNTRGSVMKWSGMGEFKALTALTELCKINFNKPEIVSAILLGASDRVALETVIASDTERRAELKFDAIYKQVYFVPLNEFGLRLMRIITLPDSDETIKELLFESTDRSYDLGQFEYDAYIDGVYILSHLNGDIARLIRFKKAAADPKRDGRFEVVCFPEQAGFVTEYVGQYAAVRTIDMDLLESELEMEESI